MSENTQVVLRKRSEGIPVAEDFEVRQAAIPSAEDDQLLCETLYLSLDPYLRGKISGRHM